ncbi:hypothetical protein IFM89_029777 [Coptis chinensis]|uniref:KIB1-4 beta-propeller domain-containing protein n=1 Tax=Coptis chinensis TaxID=261450 RepID=A0A835M2D2_9MAGN|nr:hypothetical protein IFM89_029777 [Coptis chinensis]
MDSIPVDIIEVIGKRLDDIDDHVRFGAVCKTWRSLKIGYKKSYTPWLMLPERDENNSDGEQVHNNNRKFVCLSSGKTFNVYLPECQGSRCFGSPFGWLLTVGLDLNIHLLNPLTRVQLSLPPQRTFPFQSEYYIEPSHLRKIAVFKFVMSSSMPDSENDCIVMVICSQFNSLAFARPGDETWTIIDSPPQQAHSDILFFNGRFYAIHAGGILRICEINEPVPKTIDFLPPPDDIELSDRFYLVEISGHLHLVARGLDQDQNAPEDTGRYVTDWFEVYKLNFDAKKWIVLSDFGDYSIFIGTNSSFAISTSEYPGFKANYIYFTDDHEECYKFGGGHNMGFYDFDNQRFGSFYVGEDIISFFCPPLFFRPSLG